MLADEHAVCARLEESDASEEDRTVPLILLYSLDYVGVGQCIKVAYQTDKHLPFNKPGGLRIVVLLTITPSTPTFAITAFAISLTSSSVKSGATFNTIRGFLFDVL